MRAYLGIGSNLGDRWANLHAALAALGELDASVIASSVYETAPVGGPSGQGPYLNCVARVDTELTPLELLATAQRAEIGQGRVRTVQWGPRTLDIDVLLIEGFASDDPELTVPHPRLDERAFVLAPLEELDPQAVPSDWRSRVDHADEVRLVGALLSPFLALDEAVVTARDGTAAPTDVAR